MSWEVSLKMKTGEQSALYYDVRNVTYNNRELFAAAGILTGLNEFNGKKAFDCIDTLSLAHHYLQNPDNISSLLKLEPTNGWGGLEDAQGFIKNFLDACIEHPETTIVIY